MARKRSHGEGSVFRRADGYWTASLWVEGVRRVVYGKTKAEAVRKLEELKRQASVSGTLPKPGKMTLDELLDAFLEAKRAELKPATWEHYALLARTYLRPALGGVLLSKLTPHRIQVFLSKLADRPRVCQLAYHVVKMALDCAVRWGYLAQNPCERVKRPRWSARRKEVWSEAQLRAFLTGARRHRLYALWLFLLTSGCRLGEALALEWADVDFEAGSVRICKAVNWAGGKPVVSGPKTRSAVRTLTLPPQVMAVLRGQLAGQVLAGCVSKLVFPSQDGGYLHRSTVAHALKRECERLGVPALSPHGLRHLHASLLLAKGLPLSEVAERLGHAHTGVTAEVYSHALRGGEAASRVLGELLDGEAGR